ncbi:MAG TPA: tripartite tricarboxylate transporter substrate binding protein BugD [Burkholderiaceae bacterium]|nr:tripartite tricarboxylate transporter substrate binding protein BugD [Burkholderiaceae bacterium]
MSRSQAPAARRRLGRLAAVFATALAAGSLSGAAFAQAAFPSRPVTLVVPFAAGGPTDVVARTLGQAMTKHLGQTVIVENTVGAGGTIGVNRVARAQPDGYTVLIHHNGMATAVGLYRKLTFNPLTDFEYIGQVADVPMTLLAKKTMPANTLPELIAYLKANKDKVTVANAGLGAVSHLCGMLFMSAIQTELTTVPYKGTAPAMTDLLGGQVDVLCDQTTQTLPQIKAGNVKLYGVTASKRISSLPTTPTLAEQGLPGFEVVVWHGVYAPKGTPKAAVDKLNEALRQSLQDADVKAKLADLGAEIVPPEKQTPQGLQTWVKSEIDKWTPIIRKAGVYAD